MIPFLQKHSLPIFVLLLLSIAGMSLYFPAAAPVLGMAVLLFSLAVSIHSIFQKHKQAESPRAKITKDVLVLVFTLLLIIFLGGLAGLFAAQYAWSQRWGMVAGFILAMLASFAVGYAVHRAAGKITRG
jgi:F0F1-type ATP synthase assembly protein I